MEGVYRVVDVQADLATGVCYIYCRSQQRKRHVFSLPALFEVVIGLDGSATKDDVYDLAEKYNDVRVQELGNVASYYRGMRTLLALRCTTYRSMKSLLTTIKYKERGKFFVCNGYSTVEDATLLYHELYGATHVRYEGEKLYRAREDQCFLYEPVVASFDLEMLSLDVTTAKSEPYMCSYVTADRCYLIYSQDFLDVDLLHDGSSAGDVVYMRVGTRLDVVTTLASIIERTDPDIITGYNVYNADVPVLYFAFARHLLLWKRHTVGPQPYFHNTKKLEKRFVDSEAGIAIKVPGTHLVDMYAYLLLMLPKDEQSDLTLGTVGSKYLGVGKDPLTYKDLARIYDKGTVDEKIVVAKYCVKDACIAYDLYKYFNVWNYHTGIYSKCGVDPQRCMSKGIVETTYGLFNVLCHKRNMVLDVPTCRIFKPTGGLVVNPVAGYYEDVYNIDVKSLYPNIVVQHCLDTNTLHPFEEVSKYIDLSQLHNGNYYMYTTQGALTVDVLMDSRANVYAVVRHNDNVMPTVLKELMESRDSIKAKTVAAQRAGDSQLALLLSAEESAIKTLSNGACGARGEQSDGNPISHCLVNDIITTTGRKILSLSKEVAVEWGAQVIYGDTDSLFVKCEDVEGLLQKIHEHLPERIRFKVEYLASQFVMGSKKHYVARTGDTVKISGFKAGKTSSCRAVKNAFSFLVDVCLRSGPDEMMYAYQRIVEQCIADESLDVGLFVTKMSYKGKEYADSSYAGMVVKCMKRRGVEMVPGNYMEVVPVKTFEQYARTYNEQPATTLPHSGCLKSERIYTVEELYNDVRLVDVQEVFDVQCRSVIKKITQCYSATSRRSNVTEHLYDVWQ
jgi:DNA polymerase elongation subunit (family B)